MCDRWDKLVELAGRTVDDEASWGEFWSKLRPELEGWLGNPQFLGRISQREDHIHDIVLLVWEKLQDRDYNKLRAFFDILDGTVNRQHEDAPSSRRFRGWMRRVCKNIGIDFMRTLPEFQRERSKGKEQAPTRADTGEARWRSVVTLGSHLGAVRDPVTIQNLARQMLEFLDAAIPERQHQISQLQHEGMDSAEICTRFGLEQRDIDVVVRRARDRSRYRPVVELWSQGLTTEEIATALALDDSAHAYRLLNAAKQLLRRRFQL